MSINTEEKTKKIMDIITETGKSLETLRLMEKNYKIREPSVQI